MKYCSVRRNFKQTTIQIPIQRGIFMQSVPRNEISEIVFYDASSNSTILLFIVMTRLEVRKNPYFIHTGVVIDGKNFPNWCSLDVTKSDNVDFIPTSLRNVRIPFGNQFDSGGKKKSDLRRESNRESKNTTQNEMETLFECVH